MKFTTTYMKIHIAIWYFHMLHLIRSKTILRARVRIKITELENSSKV